MRVLIVSGIWPPDVGGPATHAPEIADALTERGHDVEVVTTASAPPPSRRYPIRFVARRLPPGVRHAAAITLIARRSRAADVVYATSMVGRSAAATSITRTPLVVKVAGDPAYERSLRRGLYTGHLDEFEAAPLGLAPASLRKVRTLAARRAAHLVCPSEFLRGLVVSWGVAAERVSVVANAMPAVGQLATREAAREQLGMEGPTLAFAGRLTRAKALEVALAAVDAVEGVRLWVVGDGEERAHLEALAGERVRFLGALPRQQVLEVFRAADASLLSSSWENFPHTVVEALAVGTPVIATRVGGVPEIVVDETNGLLVEPGDAKALAEAIRRFFADATLREQLRAGATRSVARFSPEIVYDQIETILTTAARNYA